MRCIAIIPARYQATRFPGKLLQTLGNKPVLAHTYLNTLATGLFDDVVIATDDNRIAQEMQKYNAKVVLTHPHHATGSDRIAEVVKDLDVDLVVNVQGDEPFTQKSILASLIALFQDPEVDVGTLMIPLNEWEEIENPNNVKVVVDHEQKALYFSRSPIPYPREKSQDTLYFKHLGIYAYTKNALMQFADLPVHGCEKAEKLEQLRYLENGFTIKLALTHHVGIGIDTPQDLEKAKAYLAKLEQ